MRKVGKIIVSSLILANFYSFGAYAGTTVAFLKGSGESEICQQMKIDHQLFDITLSMPIDQFHYPLIDKTHGFTLPHQQQVSFNNEGVQGSCDYYIHDYPIWINGKQFSIQRLTVLSTEKTHKQECTNVFGELDIAPAGSTDNTNICIVSLTSF